ncbi:MAG: hypothetical protein O2816_15865 [Planctomycetota bacterium]|nr:hypothetical protein [Planctomycetota bacterium]
MNKLIIMGHGRHQPNERMTVPANVTVKFYAPIGMSVSKEFAGEIAQGIRRLNSTDEHTSAPPLSRIGVARPAWSPATAEETKEGGIIGSSLRRLPRESEPRTSRACSSVRASSA